MNRQSAHRWIIGRWLTLACGAVLLAAAAPAQEQTGRGKTPAPPAEPQQFPPDRPAFRFDLPTNWTVDRGNNDKSVLICNLKGQANIGLVCLAVPNLFSLEDFTNILPGLAREQLNQQNLTDLQIASQGASQTGACPSYFVIMKGKLRDRAMTVTFIGLVSEQGRACLMEYALPSADGPAHMKDFQKIAASLAPIIK